MKLRQRAGTVAGLRCCVGIANRMQFAAHMATNGNLLFLSLSYALKLAWEVSQMDREVFLIKNGF